MLAGYNNYPSQEQMIMSWKTHCQNKRYSRLTSSPLFGCQSSMSSCTKVSEMNVDDTARWIRNVAKSKRWAEADVYAQSFKNNNITGYLLDKLETGSLKSELGIMKYGHRLEIMAAINEPYSNASNGGEKGNKEEKLPSNSSPNTGLNGYLTREGRFYGELGNELSNPNRTAACLWTSKSAGAVENGYQCTLSPVCSRFCGLSEQAQEVQKWVNPGTKTFSARKLSNGPLAYFFSTKRENLIADRVKGGSKRARPGNHIAYKALHKVTIQKGKAFSSSIVGQLVENSIVLINQIKGRRGRIVLRKPSRELVVVGWVPLFTSKGQQLLAKHNKKGGAEVQNSDATIEWRTKSPLEDLKPADREPNGSEVDVLKNETCLKIDLIEPLSDIMVGSNEATLSNA